jgi:plasmid stabilization system protein ParE
MKFTLLIVRRAENDVERMYRWLSRRFLTGAIRWREEYVRAITDLTQDPLRFAFADEASLARREVRQRIFGTPRGGKYRILFGVSYDRVRILRVRGPGQPPLRRRQV